MHEVKKRPKCPKCGSSNFEVKRVQIPDAKQTFITSLDATGYICQDCGYIEFYKQKRMLGHE